VLKVADNKMPLVKKKKKKKSSMFHVKREINSIAHNCAQQAITLSQSLPIFIFQLIR
jgi:hypothetical protein